MNSPANNRTEFESVSPPSSTTSLCFRAPGGRIGLPRLRGMIDLLDSITNLTLMVTRRQALVVRGHFGEAPDYIHEELESHTISSPNVKSYPIDPPGTFGRRLVRRLDDVLTQSDHHLSISHSPCPRFRGELRRDDLCVVEDTDGHLKLVSTLWSPQPRTIIDSIPRAKWHGIADGLSQLTQSSDPAEWSLREASRMFTRALNRADSRDTSPRSSQWVDETALFESFLSESIRFPDMPLTNGNTRVLIVTVPAGLLSVAHLRTILDVAAAGNAHELYFTPEQNVLIPLDTGALAGARSRLMGELGHTNLGHPFRVSTCPGSRFCTNASLEPVTLVRQLSDFLIEFAELNEFNRNHPIGITGCGETRELERLHPVGLAPSETGPGYDLLLGGSLHGSGRMGSQVEDAVVPDQVHEVIEHYIARFHQSEMEELIRWVDTL